MRTFNGFALSLALSMIGVAVWIGLAMAIDTRLWVILACAIGGLAGYGMGMGTKAAGGPGHGVLAAVVCVIACFTATGVIGYLHADRMMHEEMTVTDDDAYDHLCYTTYNAWLEDGLAEWDEDGDYPAEVYESADEQWAAMTQADREDYKAAVAAEWNDTIDAGTMTGVVGAAAFIWQWFGLLPIICLCSAIGTAYKVGSFKKDTGDEAIPAWALGQPAGTSTTVAAPAGPATAPGTALTPAPAALRPAAQAAPVGEPQDAASSFWNKLGSDAPARTTPSLKRTPKPAPTNAPASAEQPTAAKAA